MPVRTRASKRLKESKKVKALVEVVIDVPRKVVKRAAPRQPGGKFIGRLPNEILGEIFAYLPWTRRGHYMSVCRKWNTVMLEQSVLWQHPPTLKGKFSEIISKMIMLRERSGTGLQSLSLYLLPDIPKNIYYRSNDKEGNILYHVSTAAKGKKKTKLDHVFPTTTLRHFKYRHMDGAYRNDDDEVWDSVVACEKLETLDWSTSIVQMMDHNSAVNFCIEGESLQHCKLDEFVLNVGYFPEIDDAFIDIISKAKKLHLNGRLKMHDLAKILDRVKDTIVELEFTNLQENYHHYEGEPTWEEIKQLQGNQPIIHMPLLQKFKAIYLYYEPLCRSPLPTPYRIIAPQVTSLSFLSVPSVDWVLIESCRSTLKSLLIDAHDGKLTPRLVEELFNFPELVELRLESSADNSDYRSAQNGTYFFTSFWNAIETGETDNPNVGMEDILPKLKKLTIIDDPQLEFEQVTKLLDLIPLEELIIWTYFNRPFSTEEIEELKTRVQKLDVRNEGEWDYPDTKWAFIEG